MVLFPFLISSLMKSTSLVPFVRKSFLAEELFRKEVSILVELVDGLYNQVYLELLTYMMADPGTIDRSNYLIWVAHNLERMSDRVTNICERIVFVATGEILELDISDDEMSDKFHEKITE